MTKEAIEKAIQEAKRKRPVKAVWTSPATSWKLERWGRVAEAKDKRAWFELGAVAPGCGERELSGERS